MKIDVLILNGGHALIVDDTVEFDENNVRCRITLTELNEFFIGHRRIPVGTEFFKKLQKNDIVEIILH